MKRNVALAVSAMLIATLGLAGCSSATSKATSTATPKAMASASSTGARFSSTTFTHAFGIVLPTWAPAMPSTESTTFVTWESADSGLKLRVMAPVVLFVPNSSTAIPVPTDYSRYLLGLAGDGVHFTDVAHLVISGHRTVVVTGTTDDPKDGSLGCPTTGMSASDCFAFQPDLVLRLADIDDNGQPVLVWLRDDVGAKNLDADLAAFDKTLGTLTITN